MCKMARMSLEEDSKPFNREFWKPENPEHGPGGLDKGRWRSTYRAISPTDQESENQLLGAKRSLRDSNLYISLSSPE